MHLLLELTMIRMLPFCDPGKTISLQSTLGHTSHKPNGRRTNQLVTTIMLISDLLQRMGVAKLYIRWHLHTSLFFLRWHKFSYHYRCQCLYPSFFSTLPVVHMPACYKTQTSQSTSL